MVVGSRRCWCRCWGLWSSLLHYLRPSFHSVVIPLFSLSIEGNFPTWYASGCCFGCGLWFAVIALGVRQRGDPTRGAGALLSAGFVFMSLDEAIEIHENLGRIFDLHGVLFFSWVVPAGIWCWRWGFFYLPFLRHLPRDSSLRFVLAGGLYRRALLLRTTAWPLG